jgi:hypothetical protein
MLAQKGDMFSFDALPIFFYEFAIFVSWYKLMADPSGRAV